MKKRTKTMFSLFLALCMLLSGLPWAPTVVAVEADNPPSEVIENEDAPINTEISVVEEDISLRGEYEKHFLMSDGSYQAVVYSYPVHELVDGVWVEIESTNQLTRGSISTDTERTNIVDNYVLQGAGVQDRNRDRLYIGNRSEGLTRAFIRFATMPTLPSGAIITDATMSLTLTNGTDTAANASAYMVTGGSWESGEIQWSNMPAANTLLQSSISHNDCTGYTFSCLTAVQHWYDGDTTGQNENYGIMLRYYDETIDDYNAVYSADYTDESKRPFLTIYYEGAGGGSSFTEAKNIRTGESVELYTVSANEMRYYQFEPGVTGKYIIQSSNSSGDPKVWLYTSDFEFLGANDDGGDGLDFRLSVTLTAGQKYYIAAGHAVYETGSYSITILHPAEVESGFYCIQNLASYLCLDIHGPQEQKYVHHWTNHSDAQGVWLVQKHPSGFYTIRSQYGDKFYVGITSPYTSESNIQLFPEISTNTQWNIYCTHEGNLILEPFNAPGKAMYAPNTTIGAEMQLAWMGTGGTSIEWYAIPFNYSGFTFSAFDIGDSSEDEVSIVKNYLEYFEGYTDIGTYRNTEDAISGQLIKDISRYSDIVYINGHGLKKANLRIQDSAGSTLGWLCAESSIDFGDDYQKTEIGAEWKLGSTTVTESAWNKRTKWVILAQCDQFNSGSEGDGTIWDGLPAANVWGRTMLGDGERLHGFLGYYNGAPEGEAHTSRLEQFLYHTQEMSIIDAWKEAHPSGLLATDTNWAVMYHRANSGDRIDSFSESSSPEITRSICLEKCGAAKPTSSLSTSIKLSNNSYPILVDNMDTESIDALYSALSNELCVDEFSVLQMDENNKIIFNNYNNHTGEPNIGMSLSDEQIVNVALQKLEALNLAPSGDYRTCVSYVHRYELDESGTEFINHETIEYTVFFYRTYNGADLLSDKGEGIVVSFNKYGLTELQYKWSNIQVKTATQLMTASTISQEQAQNIYHTTVGQTSSVASVPSDSSAVDESIIRAAYLQIENEIRPVWVCSANGMYGSHIFIDMITGEQVMLP